MVMNNSLYLSTKKDWALAALAIITIVLGIWQMTSGAIFKPEQLLLPAGGLFFMFNAFMINDIKFEPIGKGKVDAKEWIFVAYKRYHYDDLTKAKAIVIYKVNRWGDFRIDSRILLFEDGYKIPLPDDEQAADKVAGWFLEKLNIEVPITEEIKTATLT
jgi:hypothetical protein